MKKITRADLLKRGSFGKSISAYYLPMFLLFSFFDRSGTFDDFGYWLFMPAFFIGIAWDKFLKSNLGDLLFSTNQNLENRVIDSVDLERLNDEQIYHKSA